MNKKIVMNPDILPTFEEWELICDGVRQQQEEIEALKQHWSDPQTDLIVLLREEVTLMQKYLQEQNLREHFVAWRQEK
jgi:hypothetical protein